MKIKTTDWSIKELYEARDEINPADYQREPKLWKLRDKQRLIDSILREIDIPKIYFNKLESSEFEVVDGQQRLGAIWQYIDDEYAFNSEDEKFSEYNGKKFTELPDMIREKIYIDYKIQITEIDNASTDYLRKLFLRLQLGLLLVTGEKLHAETGHMKDFIFDTMVEHPFIIDIKIPKRRYAKQTLCAQICINSFTKQRIGQYSRTRYEDLKYFFEDYKKLEGDELTAFNKKCRHIISVLDILKKYFDGYYKTLRNRSFILSIYLFVEELAKEGEQSIEEFMPELVEFISRLWNRLKEEAKKGIDRKNKELYSFDKYLSNAPGEKYQIKNRHEELKKFFEYYQTKGKILGD